MTHILLSQNNRVENTVQFHKALPNDKLCYTLNDSSFNIRFSDPELALQFARRALPVAEKIKDEHLTATSWFNIGTAFHIIGTYDSAMYYYQKAEKFFLKSGNPKFIGTIYLQVGLLFSDSHDEKSALAYTYKSVNYFYLAKDTMNIIGAYSNIAVFYQDIDSVLHYHMKALNLVEQYVGISPEDKALKLSISHTNIGNTYQRQKKYNEAIYHYKLALEADEHHNDFLYKLSSYENLGSCYQVMGEARKAITVLLRAINESKGKRGYRSSHHLYNSVAFAYSDLKMADSAYYFLREYTFMQDSINDFENQKIISDMQQKYDNDKKETEIELLNKDKEAANTFKKTLYAIIGLILVVVIVLVYSYIAKRRSNKKLVLKNEQINQQKGIIEHQKLEVEHKQKEIIDSINYARRIQQSLMPTDKYIGKKLDELKK